MESEAFKSHTAFSCSLLSIKIRQRQRGRVIESKRGSQRARERDSVIESKGETERVIERKRQRGRDRESD